MAEINDWSSTAASNTTLFPEAMARAAVNNGMREVQAILKRQYADNNGSLVTAGSSTVYTITLNSQHAAWFDGLTFEARLDETCGATPTINPTGSGALGAKTMVHNDGTAIAAGDLIATGVYRFCYKSGTDRVHITNSSAPVVAASETVAGKAELATQAETNTGTDDNRIVTPLKLTTWTPAVTEVTPVSGDFALIGDTSASGILKKAQTQKIAALARVARQITNKTDTSTVAITAGTFADMTGISVAITATSGARIVIKFSITLGVASGPDTAYIKLQKDSADLSTLGAAASNRKQATWAVTVASNNNVTTLYAEFEDTAADGNAHTYKLVFTASASENWHINRSEADTDSSAFARFASWILAEEWVV